MNNPDYIYWAKHYYTVMQKRKKGLWSKLDIRDVAVHNYRNKSSYIADAEQKMWWCIFLAVGGWE